MAEEFMLFVFCFCFFTFGAPYLNIFKFFITEQYIVFWNTTLAGTFLQARPSCPLSDRASRQLHVVLPRPCF